MTTTWTKPDILKPGRFDDAVAHLKNYFHEDDYSGSFFERLGGGGDRSEVANQIAADDIVALSMLAVPVKQGWVARLLLEGPTAGKVNDLLAQIPTSLSIAETAGRKALADNQPAAELWSVVSGLKYFGRVRTSKVLARKRPHLIPIYDSVVRSQFGAQGVSDQWQGICALFEQPDFSVHLELLRDTSGIGEDISLLRVLDVVVWMEGKRAMKSGKE